MQNLNENKTGTAQRVVGRMVELAESITGGRLSKLHERRPAHGFEVHLRQALAPLSMELLELLAGTDIYVQGVPNVRIHRPLDVNSVVPFHSDVLYGHSLEELNFWVNLTPVYGSNSLWLSGEDQTEFLHNALKHERLSLGEFQELARKTAAPIEDASPGIHSFCCGRVHGSILNETESTRISLDLRVLKAGSSQSVKRGVGYFRPRWLLDEETGCPLEPGTVVATVASLDESTPVYLQRMAMEKFYPQGAHPELLEFFGLQFHAPTLADAMSRGPVLAYTIRQLRAMPVLNHPVGFVDENVWITRERAGILERLMRETRGA